jgi:phage FluMu protein Com
MSPAFIDVRCEHCQKLLCRVSRDFYGLVGLKCRHCKKDQVISLATILKQMPEDSATIPLRAPAQ